MCDNRYPADRVNGLNFLLYQPQIPVYREGDTVEQAWSRSWISLRDHIKSSIREELNLGVNKIPTWKQLLDHTGVIPAVQQLLQCMNSVMEGPMRVNNWVLPDDLYDLSQYLSHDLHFTPHLSFHLVLNFAFLSVTISLRYFIGFREIHLIGCSGYAGLGAWRVQFLLLTEGYAALSWFESMSMRP